MTARTTEAEVGHRRPVLTGGQIPPARAVVRVVCAWCRDVMQNGHTPTSHGICASCEWTLL